ncbi:MAG: DNA cytosine methyltransferase [Nitrososphaerota archaeon]|jgi:DNA (cytosine-5)-methyltransferase 1|nr:DNA cytosine methyltransferase [Nitrososphaerota archaeon]MDG7038986.1 DNA cytosine methyltransferase [Nitrososphaerota archaeon]
MASLSFVDVFAGAGGFSLGLHEAGMRGLFAVEKDPMAFSTLYHNLARKRGAFDWPAWLPAAPMAIEDLLRGHGHELGRMRGKVDVMVGGPPCQGFSVAGRRQEGDERNQLFREYMKLVRILGPGFIVLENVPGFAVPFPAGGGGRSYLQLLATELAEAGYEEPAARMVDFSRLGVPQSRKRLVVVSTPKGGDPEKVQEAIEKRQRRGRVGAAAAISDLLRSHGEVPSPDSRGFAAGVYGRVESGYQAAMRKVPGPALPDSHRFAKHGREVARRLQRVLGSHATPWAAWKAAARGESRKSTMTPLVPSLPAPTLTTLPDDHIHYSEPRILTVREYARLQSFPDWFEFLGKYTTGGQLRRHEVPRYSQVANAVPPVVSREIALAVEHASVGGAG